MAKGDSTITLPTYEKHWINKKDYGHDIVIYTQKGKMTSKCIFADRTRT